jgi:hypothetical protein
MLTAATALNRAHQERLRDVAPLDKFPHFHG